MLHESRSTKGGVMAGPHPVEKAADAGPGPLAYSDAAVRKTVPAVSMTFRKPDENDPAVIAAKRGGASLIGVAHVQYDKKAPGPAVTMAGRSDHVSKGEEKRAAEMPGPNAYDALAYKSGRRSSAATIVGRPKSPVYNRDMPGPADAVILPPRSTQGAVILGRYKNKEAHHNVGPGPGAYNVTLTHTGQPTKSSKGATMKFRPRAEAGEDPHPDPGPQSYAPPAPPPIKGGAVMKPPTDKETTSELRRTLGAVNEKKMKARDEQARRRASVVRADQQQTARRKSSAANAGPKTRYDKIWEDLGVE